ncbi:hypothetical protein TRVL_03820 [Trypanosoma vivax]|uniref:Uncharacterized protein n=1 Tax=Trypanosoma vivax (strain Y486) TaxID=1055687 RepID=G0U4Z2_TRYVY|nr:hypothetical protein TRVL_03820 [Trypanosoma vivax]CCC52507.1 conserved hypothetical protein [Trypanosoma vivax Y486]
MRRPCMAVLECFTAVKHGRSYRSPLGGGYFEEPLPPSFGYSPAKGSISTLNMRASALRAKKRKQRRKLQAPLSAGTLKARLQQQPGNVGGACSFVSSEAQDCGEASHASQPDTAFQEMKDISAHSAVRRSPVVSSTELVLDKNEDVGHEITRVGSTVLGTDLDQLERDMMRDYHQRGKDLPRFGDMYAEFGAPLGKTVEVAVANTEGCSHAAALSRHVKVTSHPNKYHSCANLFQSHEAQVVTEENEMEIQPEEANPHFPVAVGAQEGSFQIESNEAGSGCVKSELPAAVSCNDGSTSQTAEKPHDAYWPRAADTRILQLRDTSYWGDVGNRDKLQQLIDHASEGYTHEMLAEGSVDTCEVGYSTGRVRKETFLYFQAHPINEMIQESFVRVRSIVPSDGSAEVSFPVGDPDTDVDIPVSQARRMAREMGLDLIRVGALHTQISDRRVVALCTIADHREHMRDMVRFKIKKLGVQAPPTKECIEVPFRGGTHPHAIRFKSIGIAKHILHGHVVRINVTDFGTPREGFPVFQSILDEVMKQTLRLHAFHSAGTVRANYNEIYCYLYPSTGRSPKTTVIHPSQEHIDAVRDRRILEQEREIYFDDLEDKKTARERLSYIQKLQNGTAWADKDEGLSLQRQRDIKLMLGYLPKGNRELYAARGDVNVPAPFRASHPTSVEKWTHPPETNLEQAARGAATLGKRLSMTVSEMHDQQETSENPTTLDHFYYRLQGSALEAGELKEALGLKGNRKKVPRSSPGWATLGMPKNPPVEPGYATK